MPRRAPLLAVLVLATACAAGDDDVADSAAGAATGAATAAAPAATGDDLADVASYELTMDRLDRFFVAQRALALRAKELTPAERETFDVGGDANDSLDEMTRRFESNAMVVGALDEAGLSSREFATMTMAMLQSAMASAVLQMRPDADQDSLMREMRVNPANVRFMRENEAAIRQKQTDLAAELQRLGVDIDG